jgi:DnaJ-class molecular chaperone
LEKYPFKGYKPKKNIDEEYTKDNKNFIRTLTVKYHPDRYPKNTQEEKEHKI